MSPVYLNPQHSSSMPFLELKGDQFNHSLSLVGHIHDHVTSNNYFSHSYLENHHTSSGVQSMDFEYSRHPQEKVEKLVLSQVIKPNDIGKILVSPQQLQYTPDGSGCSYNYPFDHRDHQIASVNCTKQSKKCKPTKLRILQKNVTTTSTKSKITNNGDHKLAHHHHDHLAQPRTNVYRNTSNENNNGVRVCTDCHTTTTPLWRSGPQGPKSLCNACGIRQRKARRAAMAAAAVAAELAKTATTTTSPMSSSSSVTQVEDPEPKVVIEEMMMMRSENLVDRNHTLPIKKRSKIANSTNWNYNDDNNSHNYGDFGLNSSKIYFTNKSQRAFPRDEEEGAILLMALSCGLACSS